MFVETFDSALAIDNRMADTEHIFGSQGHNARHGGRGVEILQSDDKWSAVYSGRVPIALLVVEFASEGPGNFDLNIILEVGPNFSICLRVRNGANLRGIDGGCFNGDAACRARQKQIRAPPPFFMRISRRGESREQIQLPQSGIEAGRLKLFDEVSIYVFEERHHRANEFARGRKSLFTDQRLESAVDPVLRDNGG